MKALLVSLSVLEIALVVMVLAYYLIQVSRSLQSTARFLSKVTYGVRAIETQCASIGPSVVRVNGQLATIAGALDGLATQAEALAAG